MKVKQDQNLIGELAAIKFQRTTNWDRQEVEDFDLKAQDDVFVNHLAVARRNQERAVILMKESEIAKKQLSNSA